MERFFNTAGPQTPDSYTIDPLSRFDLEDILLMIRQQRYFVLHAPRQTGKTTCMLALRDYFDKNNIPYDPKDYPDPSCESCCHTH